MIYVAYFCVVAPEKTAAFISMLRDGGLYREITKQLYPRLIGINVLRGFANSFLVIQFWSDEKAYQMAIKTPSHPVLVNMTKKMTSSFCNLGVFSFPPSPDRDWQEIDVATLEHCTEGMEFEDA